MGAGRSFKRPVEYVLRGLFEMGVLWVGCVCVGGGGPGGHPPAHSLPAVPTPCSNHPSPPPPPPTPQPQQHNSTLDHTPKP